jgi:hypothetical protein
MKSPSLRLQHFLSLKLAHIAEPHIGLAQQAAENHWEQFLTCPQNALNFFGAVPQKVMIDNLKVGVLEHPLGETAAFNSLYLDLAAHYGFHPVASSPVTSAPTNPTNGASSSAIPTTSKSLLDLDLPPADLTADELKS